MFILCLNRLRPLFVLHPSGFINKKLLFSNPSQNRFDGIIILVFNGFGTLGLIFH